MIIIVNNYVGIFDSTILSILDALIIQFNTELNVRFYEWFYNLSIYMVYNPVIEINTKKIYFSIPFKSSYFTKWWFILEFYPKVHISLSIQNKYIKPNWFQWREITEYFQQLWYQICLLMLIQLWLFTMELHLTWNVRYYLWVYGIYIQGLQCMNWNEYFWQLCWYIGLYKMINFQ